MSKYEIAVRIYKSYLITEALLRFHGNQSATARDLGLHRNSLRRNMKALGIKLDDRAPQRLRKAPASGSPDRTAVVQAGVKASGPSDRIALVRTAVKASVEMPASSSEQQEV